MTPLLSDAHALNTKCVEKLQQLIKAPMFEANAREYTASNTTPGRMAERYITMCANQEAMEDKYPSLSGMAPTKLRMCPGTILIVLRNIREGIMNGTRCIFLTNFGDEALQVLMLTGPLSGSVQIIYTIH